MLTVRLLLTILFLFFTQNIFAASFQYKAFPYVPSKSLKVSEPKSLHLGKNKLHALMRPNSGTHLLWGVEQVYASADLKKRVFVKYKVKTTSSAIVGGWSKVAKGQVLHLRQGPTLIAYYAEGFNSKEINEIDKQLRRNIKQASILELFIPCANAETTEGEPAECASGCVANRGAVGGGVSWARAGTISLCVGQQTLDSAVAGAKHLWENANWESIQAGTVKAAQDAWDGLGNAWNGLGGAWNATMSFGSGAGELISTTFTDPGKAWEQVSAGFDQSIKVVQELTNLVIKSIQNFNELPEPLQNEILCNFISEMAMTGILSLAMAVTGAAAGVGIAKITLAIANYAIKIKPVIAVIKVINEAKDIVMDKKVEFVRRYLKGEVSQSELDAMKKAATPDIKPASLVAPYIDPSDVKEGTLKATPAMLDAAKKKGLSVDPKLALAANQRIATTLVQDEFKDVLNSFPPDFLKKSNGNAKAIIDRVALQLAKEQEFSRMYKDDDYHLYIRTHILRELVDEKEASEFLFEQVKKDFVGDRGKVGLREWNRVLAKYDVKKNIEANVNDYTDGEMTYLQLKKAIYGNVNDVATEIWYAKDQRVRSYLRDRGERELRDKEFEWSYGTPPAPEDQKLYDAWKKRQDAEYAEMRAEEGKERAELWMDMTPEEMRDADIDAIARGWTEGPDYKMATDKASTAIRVSGSTVDGKFPIKFAGTACDTCPKHISFRANDSHFDDHIVERAAYGTAPKETLRKFINGGPNSIASAKPADITVLKSVARSEKSTTFWEAGTRNRIVDKLADIPLNPIPKKPSDLNTQVFKGRYGNTDFLVVICDKLPCKEAGMNIGDVYSIYPVCGNGVMSISRRESFENCAPNCSAKDLISFPKCK